MVVFLTMRLHAGSPAPSYHPFRMPARFEFWPEIRKDPATSRIIAQWRALTGGRSTRDPQRKTLIACSGGADSAALAVALAAASKHIVLAHIIHDMRPAAQAHADRNATLDLAQKLHLPCVVASVACRDMTGNAEANYRASRYQALSQLAIDHACPFVATGHHRDDQIETMIMRMVRGSGFSALAGIRAKRPLTVFATQTSSSSHPPLPLHTPLTLIRPMLTVTHEDAQRLCTIAGFQWQEDATNLDASYTRGLIRTRITPALNQLNPRYANNISRLLRQLADLKPLLENHAAALFSHATLSPHAITLPRELFTRESETVLGAVLHLSLKHFAGLGTLPPQRRKQQALSAKTISKIAMSIVQPDTGPKHFQLDPLHITLTAHGITISVAKPLEET